MTDGEIAAISGLVGSLIGALAALAGTWLQARETRKSQREQWMHEQTHRNLEGLRDAYVEWLEAANRGAVRMAEMYDALDQGKKAAETFLASLRENHVLLGAKIQLLDPDPTYPQLVRGWVRSFMSESEALLSGNRIAVEREHKEVGAKLGKESRAGALPPQRPLHALTTVAAHAG